MKKINILVVGMSNNLGGIETYLISLYRNINKKIFNLKFLIFKDSVPCFYEEIKNDIIYIESRKSNYFLFKKELKELYKKYHFDIIHFNLMSFSFYEPIEIALKYSNANLILHSHVAGNKKDSFKTNILSFIGKKIVLREKFCNRYVFFGCSQKAINDLFRNYSSLTKQNSYVVNNGIDIEKFMFNLEQRKKIRKKIGLKENDILIGHVGRFTYAKNHKKILSIFNALSKKNNKYKLLLIGDGELKDKIVQLISKYQLNDRVIVLSNISDVYNYLSAMDLFVFPSIYEGLGIAIIEAETAGLHCFISNNIPNEVDLTSKIHRCNISDDDDIWVKKIEKYIETINDRTIEYSKIKQFDLKESINFIEKIYIKMIGGNNDENSENSYLSFSK